MEREDLESTIIASSAHHGVTEGTRRATGVTPPGAPTEIVRIMPSDPEVPEKNLGENSLLNTNSKFSIKPIDVPSLVNLEPSFARKVCIFRT
jgi:hypothetical protein